MRREEGKGRKERKGAKTQREEWEEGNGKGKKGTGKKGNGDVIGGGRSVG
jgi:hypothetical protein